MLEEKKAQGSQQQQQSTGFVRPKAPKINKRRRNMAAGKTDRFPRIGGILDPAGRCALLAERCARSPAPQPLTIPLIGGFPGSSLLIGQQVASLQLAQIKAQLILTQISNAFAVGRAAANLTGNSNIPAPYFAAKAPSPTAAAISLLNLLKIANSMSHPLNNPYAPGNQLSTQMQLELFNPKAERDPRRATPRGIFGLSHESAGASAGTPSSSGGMLSSTLPQSVSDLPGQSRSALDDDIEKSVDMHLSRAREAVRLISKTTRQTDSQPTDQVIHFTNAQRDKFMTSHSTSSPASLGQSRLLDDETGSSSYYKRPTADESAFYSSSDSSRNAGAAAAYSFDDSTEREGRKTSIPGLGDLGSPLSDGPSTSKEPSRPKFTSQSAAGILWSFGLEKEDLEQLITFPEDQITPENLPYILRQIRKQKQRKTTTAAELRRYPEPLQSRGMGGFNSGSSSGEVGMQQQAGASTIHQQIVDYGHASKYTGGTAYEVVGTTKRAVSAVSGRMLMDTGDSRSHNQEPLPHYSAPVKCSTSSPPRREKSPFSSLSASWSSILSPVSSSNRDPTKPAQRPDQFSLPPHSAKAAAARDPEAEHRASSQTSCAFAPFPGVHRSQPGRVVTGYSSGTKDQRESPGPESMVGVPGKKQHQEQLQQKTSNPFRSGAVTAAPASRHTAAAAEASRVLQPAMFYPADLHTLVNYIAMARLPSIRQPAAKIAVFKGLPSLAMMCDYAAASPSVFPHTCSLCNDESADIQDWISHQNSSSHLQRCKLLRQQYPEWDGEIPEESILVAGDPEPSAPSDWTSHQNSGRYFERYKPQQQYPEWDDGIPEESGPVAVEEKPSDWTSHQHSSRHLDRYKPRQQYPEWDDEIPEESGPVAGDPKRSTSSDWTSHQNSSRYFERYKPQQQSVFVPSSTFKRYPGWDDEIPEESSPVTEDDKPSVSSKSPKHRHKKAKHGSRSRSGSPSSHRHHEGKKKKRKRSRSKSPQKSRTKSPQKSRTKSPNKSRSKSPKKSRSKSPHSSRYAHRSRSHSQSPRHDYAAASASSRHHRSRSRSREKRSAGCETSSSSVERLAKKLLETSAVQSQSGLEDVVKTLAMTLAKINSSTAFSSKGGKRSPPPPPPSSSSYSSFKAKKKDWKTKHGVQFAYLSSKSGKLVSLAPTMVRLSGILNALSHDAVMDAMDRFGKTKSVVLFRSKQEALVCFESEEDARDLKSYMNINIQGFVVTVVRDDEHNKHYKVKSSTAPNVTPLVHRIQKHLDLPRAHHVDKPYETKCKDTRAEGAPGEPDSKADTANRRPETSKFKLPLPSKQEIQSEKDQSDKTPQEAGSKSAANSLTPGELLYHTLTPTMICCSRKRCFSKKFLKTNKRLLLLTNLPVHYDGFYTEADVARMLKRFGFVHGEETLYIVPEKRIAFAMMPSTEKLQRMLEACRRTPLSFKGCQIRLHLVAPEISMATFPFYKSLMKAVQFTVTDQGVKTVYAKNISQSETRQLRAAAAKIGPLHNVLPLLNRVYIEFKDTRDADRLGVWYSQLDPAPRYQIMRMKTPGNSPALCPESGPPWDSEAGATPSREVPRGSLSPLWITLRTSPFVFPTACPWFNHPDYLTITGQGDIARAGALVPAFPSVIMMTGLPEGNYKQADVAKLVWPYFSQQNIRAMYYHVIVLTLQRRAFVYFSEWEKCREFVSAYLANPPSVHGSKPTLHFLLHRTHPKYSEDLMYATLMEWSDTPVVQPESLEPRLLIAEIFHATVDVVKQVLEVVTSIAPIASFVPLANRICIEMAESRGVTQVLEQYKYYAPSNTKQRLNWNLVVGFESVKSLKKRLHESSDTRVALNIQPAFAAVPAQPTTSLSSHAGSERAGLSNARTAVSLPTATARQAAGVKREEGEMDKEDGEINKEQEESPASAKPGELVVKLPSLSKDSLRVIAAAIRRRKKMRQMKNQGLAFTEDEFTSDALSSEALVFEGQRVNMDDFVTVDKVGNDAEDAARSSMHRKSAKVSSRIQTEGEGEDASSAAKRESTNNSTSSSPSSSSKEGKSRQVSPVASVACETAKTLTGSVSAKEEMTTENAVTKSDHTVSPEATAAKSIKSGIKVEPSHHQGLEVTQRDPQGHHSPSSSLEPGLSEDTCKGDVKKSTEKQTEGDEEEDDGEMEHFQVLDSFDEQRGEEMECEDHGGSSELQLGRQESQTSAEETFQVLDSIDDEDKSLPENDNKTETRGSLRVLDGVTKDRETAGREDTGRKDDVPSSTETFRATCKASTEEENHNSQVSNGNQPPQYGNNKDAVKESEWSIAEEDTFEVLDSIDDGAAAEEDSQSAGPPLTQVMETPDEPRADEDFKPTDEEEGAHQITHSDLPTATQGNRSRRSSPTASASKDTQRDKEVAEEMVHKIREEVQVAATTTEEPGRRSARRKKEDKTTLNPPEVSQDEEATYEILDSVEDEAADDEPVRTRRSTRGRGERTMKESSKEKTETSQKEDTPTGKMRMPTRDSKERNRDRTPKKEDKVTPTRKSEEEEEATYQILDSVEEEVVKDELPAAKTTGRKGRRGRPKKEGKTKKDSTPLKTRDKDASEKAFGDEGATCQIVDSVEEETVDVNLTPTASHKSQEEEEEEPVYEIIDSLEEDQVQENLTVAEESGRAKTDYDASPEEEAPAAEADMMTSDDATEAYKQVADEEAAAKQINVTAETQGYPDNAARKEEVAAGEERASSSRETDREAAERQLLALDEVLDDEGEGETRALEPRPHSQEGQSAESLQPETVATADDADTDEEERGTSKRRHSAKEERERFLIVDEVAEEEEEAAVVAVTTRGRDKRRSRQTPVHSVRKSIRGKKGSRREEEEKEPAAAEAPPPTSLCSSSSSLVKDPSVSSSEARGSGADLGASSAEQEQPELHEEEEEEEEEEGGGGAAVKAAGKRRTAVVGPEAKRARSRSPAVTAAFKLPPFTPDNPLGLEFVVPKWGFFCNVCSDFYMAENITKELHCSSQSHYSNLEKHYQELKLTSSHSPATGHAP